MMSLNLQYYHICRSYTFEGDTLMIRRENIDVDIATSSSSVSFSNFGKFAKFTIFVQVSFLKQGTVAVQFA